MVELVEVAIIAVVAYLIGSIPSGLLVGRLYGVNVLAEGSGKTGTANTLGSAGPVAAILVLGLDLVKGVLSTLAAYLVSWPDLLWLGVAVAVAGGAAIVGHNRSVWVRLVTGRWGGGRGLVTALGALLMLHPLVVLAAIIAGVLGIAATRYMVVGAIVGTLAGVVAATVFTGLGQISPTMLPACILWAALVLIGFSDSIARLAAGVEPKLGRTASKGE